jgi:DNA replication and repair protein RecF
LCQFRNYTEREFTFTGSGAIILGDNGSGKTNLFEAIAYCSLGKSIRYQTDEQLLLFNMRDFTLDADFELLTGSCQLSVRYSGGKKNIQINQIPVRQLSQIYDYVKVVYCSPDDVYLINGSPRKRRQYFDLAIAQLNPFYIQQLKHYLHILEQRNALLKDTANSAQKKHWDEQFIQAALPVIGMRMQYLENVNRKINVSYQEYLSEAGSLQIGYEASLSPLLKDDDTQSYRELFARLEAREWLYQRSLLGPHLDDYSMRFYQPASAEAISQTAGNSYAVRDIGSQGQKRTVTLLLKIAQLELIKDAIGEYPILLLDDIFAELDHHHTDEFMRILTNHEQVFIASPKPISNSEWQDIPILKINQAECS